MPKPIQSAVAARVDPMLERDRSLRRRIPRRRKLSLLALLTAALGCCSGPRDAAKPKQAPKITTVSVQAAGEAEVSRRSERTQGSSVDCQSRRVRFKVVISFRALATSTDPRAQLCAP